MGIVKDYINGTENGSDNGVLHFVESCIILHEKKILLLEIISSRYGIRVVSSLLNVEGWLEIVMAETD